MLYGKLKHTPMKYDVIIVGAGPAGSSAACLLAEQGVRVALLERTKMPRYKACGAGIVGRAMRILPPDVKEAVERECYTAELNVLDAGLHFAITREEPILFMSMRDKLDRLLALNAQKAGADLWEECNVLDVAAGPGSVAVETSRASLSASFVIAADGSTSPIAKKAGWRETRRLTPAIEWEVPVDKEIFEKFARSARFDFGPVPSGYAWVFPKGSHLSAGAASMNRGSVNLNGLLEKHLLSLGIPLNNGVVRHGALVSSGPRSDDLIKGRILLVGDAAGLTDPVTGEGISFAVGSGQAAASALVAGGLAEASVREAYLTIIEEKILKELRPAMDLGKLLYGPAAIRNYLFRLKGQAFCEVVADVIAGKANYSELASKALAYARRMLIPDVARIFSRQDSV
jgi:geranylgeranyl reductase family protein